MNELRVAGLFAGIGGMEKGLEGAGHRTAFLCEIDPAAQCVLRARFPGVEIRDDVMALNRLPSADIVAAGWPCQDLSPAGKGAGIAGGRSGLIEEVLRLIDVAPGKEPRWVLLENVPFMLRLKRGQAIAHITRRLSELGFRWAYRVVDTRAFGLPHRRRRVLLLASRQDDPRGPLLEQDAGEPPDPVHDRQACGFYWTEGTRGLGWAVDAVPTLKGGSGIGIPSPPAIWLPGGSVILPDIRDAERLQGFPVDWSKPASDANVGQSARWRLVGNAVSVPVARWMGWRLRRQRFFYEGDTEEIDPSGPWPDAAWGFGGRSWASRASAWPVRWKRRHLSDFLRFEGRSISERAAQGFIGRAKRSTLNLPNGLIGALETTIRTSESA